MEEAVAAGAEEEGHCLSSAANASQVRNALLFLGRVIKLESVVDSQRLSYSWKEVLNKGRLIR